MAFDEIQFFILIQSNSVVFFYDFFMIGSFGSCAGIPFLAKVMTILSYIIFWIFYYFVFHI